VGKARGALHEQVPKSRADAVQVLADEADQHGVCGRGAGGLSSSQCRKSAMRDRPERRGQDHGRGAAGAQEAPSSTDKASFA